MDYKTTIIVFSIIFGLMIIYLGFISIKHFKEKRNESKKIYNIIEGVTDQEKAIELKKEIEKKKQEKNKKKPKKTNALVQLYKEYLFFDGSKLKFFLTIGLGTLGCFLIYILLSKNVLISLILSLLFLVVYYLIIESNLKKKRIKYIKSFVTSLEVISSSIIAGNSLEEALLTVTRRERLNSKLRREFILLTNNLKSNISLEEALENFSQRNYLFEEITMFCIVIQFFQKSGGRNMARIFESLKKSLNQKVENYSLIESKISMYTVCFNIFAIVELAATIICPFFFENFYENIAATTLNMLKLVGSVAVTCFAVVLFKNSIKRAAEA